MKWIIAGLLLLFLAVAAYAYFGYPLVFVIDSIVEPAEYRAVLHAETVYANPERGSIIIANQLHVRDGELVSLNTSMYYSVIPRLETCTVNFDAKSCTCRVRNINSTEIYDNNSRQCQQLLIGTRHMTMETMIDSLKELSYSGASRNGNCYETTFMRTKILACIEDNHLISLNTTRRDGESSATTSWRLE